MNDESKPFYAAEMKESLDHCVTTGAHSLRATPGLLKIFIKEGLWREHYSKHRKRIIRYDRFEDFVTANCLEGLASDIETLRRLCAHDPEAIEALEQELKKGGEEK